jgi:hypothetical protein
VSDQNQRDLFNIGEHPACGSSMSPRATATA